MTFEEICGEIRSAIDILATAANCAEDDILQRSIQTFREDIESNKYTVVVLGEFKRGKSTLLNALLGQDVLPVDVTPTTATINVLRYSETPFLTVHRPDGSDEDAELNESSLHRFVADADFDPNAVSYLEIGLPSDLLSNGMIYVDTPGVDDLNQSRSEITCRFVPRADAVIFLLDATSPVTRSESDFLNTSVLSSGVEKLLFVANFADMVDDEEHDALVCTIRNRLASALSHDIHNLVMISAKRACQAALDGDTDALGKSGLPQLQTALAELQSSGPGSMSKARQFVRRGDAIVADLRAGLAARRTLADASESDLTENLRRIESSLDRRAEKRSVIDDWVRARKDEIILMTTKSLNSFESSLSETVDELVTAHTGPDFKEFVETRIPRLVKRECKAWIEGHSGPIGAIIDQFDHELTKAMEQEFQTHMPSVVNRRTTQEMNSAADPGLSVKDVSRSNLIAGLVTGGAAALMIALGAPVFLPLISMVGFPFLQRTVLQKHLESAKNTLKPQLNKWLSDTTERFYDDIVDAIGNDMEILRLSANARYDDLLETARRLVDSEIASRQNDRESVRRDISKFDEIDRLLCEVDERLTNLKTNESLRECKESLSWTCGKPSGHDVYHSQEYPGFTTFDSFLVVL